MTIHAELLIDNAGQVLTLASPGGPKRGAAMRDLGLVAGGAVAVRDGRIVAVGPSAELRRTVRADRRIDAGGGTVMPGFVDPHTHLVWAGDRADEFEMRIAGASYMEIMAAGGGIMNTVRLRERPAWMSWWPTDTAGADGGPWHDYGKIKPGRASSRGK